MKSSASSYLRKLITAAGTLWLLYLLYQLVAQHGFSYFLPQNLVAFSIATLLLLVSMLSSSAVFYCLINADPSIRFRLTEVFILHHIGQILRHLPGRFWGFAYQLDALPQPEQRAMIANANIILMMLSLTGTLAVATLVLGWHQQLPQIPAFIASLLCFFTLLLLLKRGIRSLLFILHQLLPASWLTKLNQRITVRDLPLNTSQCARIVLLICLSWSLYLLSWVALASAFPVLANLDIMVLAAWYSLAWLIGFLSAITPSGIGIREGSFFLLSAGVADLGLLVFLAAFIRLWFMLADLILGLFAWLLARNQSSR